LESSKRSFNSIPRILQILINTFTLSIFLPFIQFVIVCGLQLQISANSLIYTVRDVLSSAVLELDRVNSKIRYSFVFERWDYGELPYYVSTGEFAILNPNLVPELTNSATKPEAIVVPPTISDVIQKTQSDVITHTGVVDPPQSTLPPFVPAVTSSSGIDFNRARLDETILTKFPFCIPKDFANIFQGMATAPSAPHFSLNLSNTVFRGGGNIDFDLSNFNKLALVCRWAFLILFNIALISATRRLIGNG